MALFQGTAWSQTKNEKEDAWMKGVRSAAPKAVAKFGTLIAAAAKRHDIPSAKLGSIMLVESSGNAHVPGGLMQAGESAKRATGIHCNTREPQCSIEVSAAYLKKLRHTYKLDWPRVVLAYNKGPNAARRIKKPYQHQYLQRYTNALIVYNDANDALMNK
ncbi:MAG: transglycosylase SLT domain-containing protein [Minisyncoccota bacterium]